MRINALCANGCKLIHLRKPGWDLSELRAWCGQIDPAYLPRLTLHGSPDWAQTLGCGGWHGPAANQARGGNLRHSQSWHALSEPHDQVDYGFLSPIWPSTSKQGYGPKWTQAELAAARDTWRAQVVALGGITPQRCRQARAFGFAGAAVLGWLWSNFDEEGVVSRWRQLEAAWRE